MRRLTTIPPLVLALVLGGLSVPCEAQLRQPSDVQPAQKPEREFQRELQKSSPSLQGAIGGKLPSQSGPGTNELPTNRGINMGKPFSPGLDPGTKFPGAGGADRNQPIGQTTPALPASTDPLANRIKNNQEILDGAKGTKVGPEYFSKERQLKDLTDPESGMKDLGAGMKDAGLGSPGGKNPLTKSPEDLLGGIQTTVTPGEGKNTSSRQGQQSEDGAAGSTSTTIPGTSVSVTSKPGDGSLTMKGNRGEVTWRMSSDGKLASETLTVRDKDLTLVMVTDFAKDTTTFTATGTAGGRPWTGVRVDQGNKEGKWTWTWTPGGTKKMPDPQTDGAGTPVPQAGILGAVEKAQKTLSEMQAERKRQVTLPGEGQSQPARVYASPEDALKEGIRQRTDGRIDPGDPNAATPTGSGSTTPRLGFGPERVDGRVGQPHFEGNTWVTPHVVPARPGNTPDNPTASQGSTSSQVPSTSTDKNTGGTTGDASNKP